MGGQIAVVLKIGQLYSQRRIEVSQISLFRKHWKIGRLEYVGRVDVGEGLEEV